MSHNWELGQIGEELAATYLMNKGYRILHRNWNLHRGCELDIVAMKDGKLHFVEVKTRSRAYDWKGGRPEEAVDMRKLRNMGRAIMYYRAYFHRTEEFCIDIIGIIYRSDSDYDLNFMENISIPVKSTCYTSRGKYTKYS